nr:U exon protein [Siadenovirus sp.]
MLTSNPGPKAINGGKTLNLLYCSNGYIKLMFALFALPSSSSFSSNLLAAMGSCNSKCCETKLKPEFVEGGDTVDAANHEVRVTATQLLCQTCLYWLIRYCIQNPDLILSTLFPQIHEQVDG